MLNWLKRKKKNLTLEEALIKKERAFKPLSTKSIRSSHWQYQGDTAVRGYKSIYREARYNKGYGWRIYDMEADENGKVTSVPKIKDCPYFEALQHIGGFENSRKSGDDGAVHEKLAGEGLYSIYYVDSAHDNGLFIDDDGLPHLNEGGSPQNSDFCIFSKEELVTVGAIEIDRSPKKLLNLEFNISGQGYSDSDVKHREKLMKHEISLSKALTELRSSVEQAFEYGYVLQRSRHSDSWKSVDLDLICDYLRGGVTHCDVFLKKIKKNFKELELEELRDAVQILKIEMEIVLTVMLKEAHKNNVRISSLFLSDGLEHSTVEEASRFWMKHLKSTLQDVQKDIEDKGLDSSAMNPNVILMQVMEDYSFEDFQKLFSSYEKDAKKFLESFDSYTGELMTFVKNGGMTSDQATPKLAMTKGSLKLTNTEMPLVRRPKAGLL